MGNEMCQSDSSNQIELERHSVGDPSLDCISADFFFPFFVFLFHLESVTLYTCADLTRTVYLSAKLFPNREKTPGSRKAGEDDKKKEGSPNFG